MILHTIIDPMDIFYEQNYDHGLKNETFYATDPYKYLEMDEYYKMYVSKEFKSKRRT